MTLIKEGKEYRLPKGTEVKPSAIGYYNYWYPDEKRVFLTQESLKVEPIRWTGSNDWGAVYVSADTANKYESPIKVLWVRKNLLRDMTRAPKVREFLKKRAKQDE
tara:strand:- start:1375 stop:1689 length:315 start_codon:yes stop_codon:yes gene_type:complete